MKATPHNSKPRKIIPKTVYQEYYLDMFTLRQTPVSQDYLLKFALEWVNWAIRDDDALTLEGFYILKGVQQRTVDRWCERCPELQEAHDYAMMVIGDRREKGAIKRKYSEGIIKTTMCMYKTKWKELEEWRAHLSEKISAAGGMKVVEIEKFSDADLLPKKDKK